MNEWISVKNQMPNGLGPAYPVLVYDDSICGMEIAWRYYDDSGWCSDAELYHVTHWMSLPEPPVIKKSCPECGKEISTVSVMDYLIEDIKHLSDKNINKLYKYVRRYLVANIEGLIDPIEKSPLSKEQER